MNLCPTLRRIGIDGVLCALGCFVLNESDWIKNDFTRFSWISFDVNEMLTPFSIILSCSCVTTSGYS